MANDFRLKTELKKMDHDVDLGKSRNCEAELTDNFCPNCGSPKTLKRIDGKYILSEIVSVFNFDKGFFYTLKELAIRPDKCIQNFILNDRSKLVKPITFVIFCSLIYTISQQYSLNKDLLENFGSGYSDALGLKKSYLVSVFQWLKNNYGYTNIIISIFTAIWIKIFFKRFQYNTFEIFILLFYVLGMGTLIYSLFEIFDILTGTKLSYFGLMIVFVYTSWAIGQFFNRRKRLNYFKGSIVYLLGMISFYFIVLVLGTLADIIVLNSN